MPGHPVKIYAHKGIGLEVAFGNGQVLSVPAGGEAQETLTGDRIGLIRAVLESQEAHERMGPSQFGGRVEFIGGDPEDDVPVGSKKWRRLVGEGKIKPSKKELAAAGMLPAEDEDTGSKPKDPPKEPAKGAGKEDSKPGPAKADDKKGA